VKLFTKSFEKSTFLQKGAKKEKKLGGRATFCPLYAS
jgi:hypothetical protein